MSTSQASIFPVDGVPRNARTLNLASLVLVVASLAATIFVVVVTTRAAQNPLNTSPWDARWRLIAAAWAGSLVLLLLASRTRFAIALVFGVVATVTLASALLGGFLWAILTAVWFALLAASWGDLLLRAVLRGATIPLPDRVALGVPLGFALLGVLFFGLALTQVFAFWSVNGMLLLLTGGIAFAWQRGAWRWPLCTVSLAPGRLEAFVLGAAAAFFVGGLLLAVAPETKFDALNYQLAVPAQYVRLGGLIELPWNFRSYWVGNVGMIYAAALRVAGQPAPQVLHLLSAIVLTIQAFAAGARWFGRREGWLAALLVATTPIVQEVAGSSTIDVFGAVFSFGTLYAVLIWFEDRSPEWLLVAGLLAGAAFSAKMNALTILVPAGLLVLIGAGLAQPRFFRTTGRPVLLAALAALAMALPWVAVRWAWTGNPVFPFLNNLFRSPKWPLQNERFNWDQFGAATGPIALLRLPWDITTNAIAFGEALLPGSAGALFVLVPPLFLPFVRADRRRQAVIFASTIIAALVVWFVLTPYLRYGMPFFPGLAVLAATNLVCCYDRMATWPGLPRMLPVVTLLVGGVYLWSVSSLAAVSHWEYEERYRVSVAFGAADPDEYLATMGAVYPGGASPYSAFQWLNRRGDADLRVLSLSPSAQFNLYLDGHLVSDVQASPSYPLLRNLPQDDPAALAATLQEAGFDFLIVQHNGGVASYIPNTPLLIDRDRFLGIYTREKYSDDTFSVHRLLGPDVAPATAGTRRSTRSTPSPSVCPLPQDTVPPVASAVASPGVMGAAEPMSSPMIARACLAADPNPVVTVAGQGTTFITWSTGDGSVGEVWVSQDGGSETLFATGTEGTQEAPWIMQHSTYDFRLYAGTMHDNMLAAVSVTTEE